MKIAFADPDLLGELANFSSDCEAPFAVSGADSADLSLRISASSFRFICITCSGLRGASAAGLGAFGLLGCALPDPAMGPLGSSMLHSDRQAEVISLKSCNDY